MVPYLTVLDPAQRRIFTFLSTSSFPFAAGVVEVAYKWSSSFAGIATAIGLFPSLSLENVGETRGLALVIDMPIMSCSSAIME